MKLLTTTALFSALAVAPALAQTTQPAQPTQPGTEAQTSPQTQALPAQQGELNFQQQQQPNEWSAQWLMNSNVYSMDDENLGTINDIIVGPDGNVQAVVLGVGGFLGIGEKDVAVNFESLEFRGAPAGMFGMGTDRSPDQVRPGATAPAGGGAQQQTGTAPAATQDQQARPAQPPATTQQQQTAQPPAGQPPAGAQTQTGAAQPPAGQQPATGAQQQTGDRMAAADTANIRIYLNASRDQLENAPEYNRLEAQEGGVFGGGSAQ